MRVILKAVLCTYIFLLKLYSRHKKVHIQFGTCVQTTKYREKYKLLIQYNTAINY